jgi:O-antigen/teichoic acid export membrane protein
MIGALLAAMLNTRYLGLEGQGTSGLLSFGILLIVTLSNVVGGGAAVYLIPRMAAGASVWPSLLWTFISTAIISLVFLATGWLPYELILHTAALGAIQSIFIYLSQITLARGQYNAYNIGASAQSIVLVLSLSVSYLVLNWTTTGAMIGSLYISFAATALLFAWFTRKEWRAAQILGWRKHGKQLMQLGKYAQGGNALHLLNQRSSMVILENMAYAGRAQAGLYSLTLYAAEAVWTFAKSLSVDQYARISRSDNNAEHHQLTAQNLKLSLSVSCVIAAVLALIPESWMTAVLGKPLPGIQAALWLFLPGIVANSMSIIYAHYFSGTGLHRENFVASGLGLVLGGSVALIGIPTYGVAAATTAASVGFVSQWLYMMLRYRSIKRKHIVHAANT